MRTREVYRQMQEWLGDRWLVDKTPFYALDEEVLCREEGYFEEAKYIHLMMHQQATIESCEETRIDEVFWYEHPYSVSEVAEMVWVISHENIREFLRGVPEERKCEVRFEELVTRPREVMQGLCAFMGLELQEGMLEPYEKRRERM